MFCSRCGHELPDGAKYCDSCGSAVAASTTPTASAAPTPPAASPAPTPPATGPAPLQAQGPDRQQTPRKGPNPAAIVAIVAVLAALVVGGVFFLRTRGGEDRAPATPATSHAATDSRTPQQIAYGLYLDKCIEYCDEYGYPDSKVVDGDVSVATGLCVAKLVDFDGDGFEELLVCYNTNSAENDSAAIFTDDQVLAFKVEVWSYKDGAISLVYDEPRTVSHANGGSMWLTVFEVNGKPALNTLAYDAGTDSSGYYYENSESVYHTFDGSAFSAALSLSASFTVSDQSYKVNGKTATDEEYANAASSVHDDGSPLGLVTFTTYNERCLPSSETVSLTNQVIDVLKSGEPRPVVAPASYTYEIVATTYTIADAYTASGDGSAPAIVETTWSYPRFTLWDGSTTSALESINADLRNSCEFDASATAEWDFDTQLMQTDYHEDKVMSISGNIASVLCVRSETAGGVHGFDGSYGKFFDLSTGDELTAYDALGTTEDELAFKGKAAIRAFLADNPSDLEVTESDIEAYATDMSRYARDDKGVFIITRSYELGSYAFGSHRIYVVSNDGGSSFTGTEVDLGH